MDGLDRLLANVVARDAAEDFDRATGWVRVTTCDGAPDLFRVHGPYAEPAAALAAAAACERELNEGDPAAPFHVTVHPVLPPGE